MFIPDPWFHPLPSSDTSSKRRTNIHSRTVDASTFRATFAVWIASTERLPPWGLSSTPIAS